MRPSVAGSAGDGGRAASTGGRPHVGALREAAASDRRRRPRLPGRLHAVPVRRARGSRRPRTARPRRHRATPTAGQAKLCQEAVGTHQTHRGVDRDACVHHGAHHRQAARYGVLQGLSDEGTDRGTEPTKAD